VSTPASVRVATSATLTAVSVEDASTYSDVVNGTDDKLVLDLIHEGTRIIEQRYKLAVMTQTLRLTLNGFADPYHFHDGAIHLERFPVASITSVTYLDVDGVTQTLSASQYRLVPDSVFARLEPDYNVTWPNTRGVGGDVTVTYVAGESSRTAVDYSIRAAIKAYVRHRYHMRDCGNEEMFAVLDSIVSPVRAVQYA